MLGDKGPVYKLEHLRPLGESRPFWRRGLEAPWEPIDVRGSLATYTGADALIYHQRPLGDIIGVDLHYTAGSADKTAEQVAEYQTSEEARKQTGAGVPFPTLAYHMFVEADGTAKYANDLGLRTWHNAGANHNADRIGICYAGDAEPNPAQIAALARAIDWCQRQLGRSLVVAGHKDAPYDTQCPGPTWPDWRPAVLQKLAQLT